MRAARSKSRAAGFALAAAALCLSSTACGAIPFLIPSSTPTATSTSTPTDTPTATFTPTPTLMPTITPTFTPSRTPTQSYLDWPIVLTDSFDDNTNSWFVGTSNGDLANSVVSITGGKYLVDITALKGVFWVLTPSVRNLANFYLTVDVENKNGLATTAYGLIFRISSGNLYFFAFSAESQVYNFTVLNNAKWRTIIDWQLSLQINQAGSNRIGVLAKGTSFYFFINGEMIDKAEDNTLKTGKVGVGLSFANTDGEMEIAFDNFEVRAPK